VQDALNRVMGLQLAVDGIMDSATRTAIRDFQRREGLTVNGIAGPRTKQALQAAAEQPSSDGPEPASDDEELEYEVWESEVSRGSRDYIRWVQQSLNRILGLGLAVDGIVGPQTRSAIRSFQKQRSLTVDGIVGPQTEAALIAAGAGSPPGMGGTKSPGTTTPSSTTWVLPANVRAAGDAQTVRYDSPPAWANGTNCTSYTDGAAELRRHILATFPGVASIGGYNCRANSANPSETSVHGVGRALDIMIRPVGGRANSEVGDRIANWLVRNASAIGVQYIIWNRVRWSGSRSPRVATYGGPNPHIDHIHVELNLHGARRATPWFNR
jgi:peptidoglycan hydrolase-like protein with peptidoglycan-binding domain